MNDIRVVEDADLLYLHLKKPNHADHSELTDDDMIIRYENDENYWCNSIECQ